MSLFGTNMDLLKFILLIKLSLVLGEHIDFMPSYYQIKTEYHLSSEKISGSPKTMYDTGATICAMNKKEFARINRISTFTIDSASQKSVTQMDGSQMQGYLGVTYIWIAVTDSYGNTLKSVKMRFHVFETIASVDVIIGEDFIKEAGIDHVNITPLTHKIKFGSQQNNQAFANQYFYNFLPNYYRVNTEYHLSNKQIPGSRKTMYDTGADTCIMDFKEFERINKIESLIFDTVSEAPVMIQADGSKMQGYLGTTYIWMTVSDSAGKTSNTIKMKFYVYETIGYYDVIIGRNFMENAWIKNVDLYPFDRTIKFGDDENNNLGLIQGIGLGFISMVFILLANFSNNVKNVDRDYVRSSEKRYCNNQVVCYSCYSK